MAQNKNETSESDREYYNDDYNYDDEIDEEIDSAARTKESTSFMQKVETGPKRYDVEPNVYGYRGLGLIIANGFKGTEEELPADKDVDLLTQLFGKMKLDVNQSLNVAKEKMLLLIQNKVYDAINTSVKCIFFAISSHGDEGTIKTSDNKYIKIQEILEEICVPKLAGIPKVILIDACRGDKDDERQPRVIARGYNSMADHPTPVRVPKPLYFTRHSDVLVVYGNVEGYRTYADPIKGGWLFQSLLQAYTYNEQHSYDHFVDVVTYANQLVLENKEANFGDGRRYKECFQIVTSLAKKLYI